MRQVGVEPSKWHDVGPVLQEYRDRLPESVSVQTDRLAAVSRWLRKERGFSFYGDIDFIPIEQYARADADRAIADAEFVVRAAESVIRCR